MRVTTNHNPHSYQQQRTNSSGKDKDFASMFADRTARNSSFDSTLFSSANKASQQKEASPVGQKTENVFLVNASDNVKDAWTKTENETGYNPLVSEDGKIVGSSLLAKHMEMEYNLMLRYGDKEARSMMSNVFSNTESAKSLVQSALERANNPLSNNKEKEQLEKEINFFELFLSYLET